MNLYLTLLPPLLALLACQIGVAGGQPIGPKDVGEVVQLVGPADSASHNKTDPRSQDKRNKSRFTLLVLWFASL